MDYQKQPIKFFILALMITMIVSIACSMSANRNNQSDLQKTAVAFDLTRTFLESQILQEVTQVVDQGVDQQATQEPPEDETVPPTPTMEAPIQPIDPPDVDYEGIRFSFDSSIGELVSTATIPGQNLGDQFMPFETFPTHFEFTFSQSALRDHFHTPKILVYPVEEYRSISSSAHDQFNILDSVLVNRPGGGTMSSLPFLPLWPAAQLFSAQVRYFEFQNGSGIRYLTMYGQDVYPVDNQNLIYTYQGITSDGKYYISAVMPVTHPGLPDDGYELIRDDPMEFYDNWEIYLLDTMRFLGEQPLTTYFPSLEYLDEMMASFEIDR